MPYGDIVTGSPTASSRGVSARMSKQRTRNTSAEVALRRELHGLGLRFRLHRRPEATLRREADIVFGPAKVAVFLDGCFWHGCPLHATSPRANSDWWAQKLRANRERDLDTNGKLSAAGWQVVRVWEHEAPGEAARRIAEMVRARARRAGQVPS